MQRAFQHVAWTAPMCSCALCLQPSDMSDQSYSLLSPMTAYKDLRQNKIQESLVNQGSAAAAPGLFCARRFQPCVRESIEKF